MSSKTDTQIITGLFRDPTKAAKAVNELEAMNVPVDRISAIVTEPTAKEVFAVESHSKVGEGAAIGAGAGGAIGALVLGFTSIGALASTGVGLLAAGPIVAALAGAGGGAAAGGVLGGLIGLGIPENEVKKYEKGLEEGAVLVSVETHESDAEDIKSVLKDHGASPIGEL